MAVAGTGIDQTVWDNAILEEERRFERMLPELLKEYEGQYAILYEGEVVTANPDEHLAATAGMERLGDVPWIIKRVSREPEFIEIESPEEID
jgi:hypothetical protein